MSAMLGKLHVFHFGQCPIIEESRPQNVSRRFLASQYHDPALMHGRPYLGRPSRLIWEKIIDRAALLILSFAHYFFFF